MLKALQLTRLMMLPLRGPLSRTPAAEGMPFEDVTFAATDGVPLRGWFVPAAAAAGAGTERARRPTVVIVHGWLWNRLGNVAGRVPFRDRDVDLMVPAKALHAHGFNVLMMDVSNHGESGRRFPTTYGPWESRDLVGAVNWLRARPDVDGDRLGILGLSMGGATALYAAPECQPIKAILAIQPATVSVFNRNFVRTELGGMPGAEWGVEMLHKLLRAPLPSRHDPSVPARRLRDTVVQYVQGTGDPWGTMEDVEKMQAATPNALPLVKYPSTGRYEGYRFISERVDDVVGFFERYL